MGSRVDGRKESGEEAKLRRRIAELESRVAELEAREKRYKKVEKLMATECVVTRILAESTSPDQVVRRILQAVCECIGWKLGDFFSMDWSANLLYYKDCWYRPSAEAERFELVSRGCTFHPGIGLPGRVLESGKPNWMTDVVKDRNFLRALIAAEAGLHSACGFPILVGNKILGVMEFFCSDIQEPDEEMLQLMASIGSRIGDFNWKNWHEPLFTKQSIITPSVTAFDSH